MQHTVEKYMPASVKEVIEKVTCDWCDEEIKEEKNRVDEVTISHRTGSSWPEFGCGEITEIDMCGKCFTTKLMPYLTAQRVQWRRREWLH